MYYLIFSTCSHLTMFATFLFLTISLQTLAMVSHVATRDWPPTHLGPTVSQTQTSKTIVNGTLCFIR